jgi:hypothetical protein
MDSACGSSLLIDAAVENNSARGQDRPSRLAQARQLARENDSGDGTKAAADRHY